MYNGIGLQTPRGSGTNGYIQSNKFFLKPRTTTANNNGGRPDGDGGLMNTKKANKDILEHDRKRQIELKLLVLQETLADQGYTDAEIADKVGQTRRDLEREQQEHQPPRRLTSSSSSGASRFSETQTHQVAARKERQLETMREALGIKGPEAPLERVVEDPQEEDGAPSPDSEGSDGEDLKHFGKGGKQAVEDMTAMKDSRKKMKEPEGKNSDERGTKVAKDTRGGKAKLNYSSDSDDSGERVGRRKNYKNRTDSSDSEDDFGRSSKKNLAAASKKVAKGRKGRRIASDSDSYSSEEYARSPSRKRKRHDTDSDSDSDSNVKKHRYGKHQTKAQRSASDDSGFDSGFKKKKGTKMASEDKRGTRRHRATSSDNDSDDEYGRVSKKLNRNSRRHDSEDRQAAGRKERKLDNASKSNSRKQDSDEKRKRDENHKEIPREMDSGYMKTNPEATKKKPNRHLDDGSGDSESNMEKRLKEKQLPARGRKHQDYKKKPDSTDESSQSDYSSDYSDDSSDHDVAPRVKRTTVRKLDDRKNDTEKHRASPERSRYNADARRSGVKDRADDDSLSKNIRKTQSREAFVADADMVGSKSKLSGFKEEQEGEYTRANTTYSRNLDDKKARGSSFLNNKEKLSHMTDGRQGSRSHTERHDDRKRSHGTDGEYRQHESYDHRLGHDSAQHNRYEQRHGHDSDRRDSYEHRHSHDSGRRDNYAHKYDRDSVWHDHKYREDSDKREQRRR